MKIFLRGVMQLSGELRKSCLELISIIFIPSERRLQEKRLDDHIVSLHFKKKQLYSGFNRMLLFS